MLHERIRDAWLARECAAPMHPVMTFALEGLVLGAGTVLLRTDGLRRLQGVRGQEARVLALLAAAYEKAVAPAVLGNIERAVRSWRDGDQCLAHIHLAYSGLCAPSDIRAAAFRLFIAETAMKAGMSPRAIFQALKIGSSYADAVEKAYNPAEPRVPAGSGSKSGEWTREAGRDQQPATSQVAQLGPPPILLDEPPVIVRPPLPEFPRSPTDPPGPGWEWHGAPGSNPGEPSGNWYNPQTGESLHPDMEHDPPIGPHWDYRAPNETWYRWFPDGRLEIRI